MSEIVDSDDSLSHYVIRGGRAGKERLDLLARLLEPTTRAFLEEAGVGPGARLLDLGCGGGHVSLLAARMVGPRGSVTGLDLDRTKLDLARAAAIRSQLTNVQFVHGNAMEIADAGSYDYAYARFLLTHLSDPSAALTTMRRALKPGGTVAVEDIDMSGSFCFPENQHFDRTVDLYRRVVRCRGGDPDIGYRLPDLLRQAGLEAIEVDLVQPLYLSGAPKRVPLVTLQNITESVLAEGLTDQADLDRTIEGLAAFTDDPTTLIALPRVLQCWGKRPSSGAKDDSL